MATLPPGVTSQQASPQASQQAPLEKQWSEFFRRPEVISGLLQFGATALTPGMGIGPALSQGAAAASRAMQFGQAQQAAQQAGELKKRQVAATERQAGAAERRAEADLVAAGQKQGLEQQKLDLERRRLEEYLKPSLAKRGAGSKPFDASSLVFRDALKVAQDIEQGFTDPPVGDPEWDASAGDPYLYAQLKLDRYKTSTAGLAVPTAGATPAVAPEAAPTAAAPEAAPEQVDPVLRNVQPEVWKQLSENPDSLNELRQLYPGATKFIDEQIMRVQGAQRRLQLGMPRG